MGRFVLAWLIVAEILVVQAIAVRSDGSELNPPKTIIPSGDDSTIAYPPVSGVTVERSTSSEGEDEDEDEDESGVAQPPVEIRRLRKHHWTHESAVGGGVIIGVLVTTSFAAVYRYIRVTRGRVDG